MVFWIILTLTLILSIVLIVMVLLQPAKGGGITAAFGGFGGQLGSTFGQRRTLEALGKGTTYTAIAIGVLCIMANLFFIPQTTVQQQGPATEQFGAPNVTAPSQPNLGTPSTAPATGEGDQGEAPAGEAPPGNDSPAANEEEE